MVISGNSNSSTHLAKKVLKRRIKMSLKPVKLLLVFIAASALLFVLYFFFKSIESSRVGQYFGVLSDTILMPDKKVKQSEGRANILILGKGGSGHEAPELTDTIILASVSFREPSTSLISIPRDIWVPSLRAKLNSVYYWGNQKEPGRGLDLTKSVVEEIVGIPVHYGVVADFSGFVGMVDAIGGITVEVPNSFSDHRYPISGMENSLCGGDPQFACRYEVVTFQKGVQKMDGETVLKFVRSRNSEGEEEGDLARAKRQQLIMHAVMDNLLSPDVLFSSSKVKAFFGLIGGAIETDISPNSMGMISRRLIKARNNTSRFVIPERLLENPPRSARYDNLYVYIPKKLDSNVSGTRSWEEIREWAACSINGLCK